MGINVMPPSIINMNEEFGLINNNPTYGMTNVKGVGSSVFTKMKKDMEELGINPAECDWNCFLLCVSPTVNKKAFEALILAGCFDCFKTPSKHCLLYTSPSPRDRQKSRMPSSA